jgi:hypothetical protein
MLHKSTTNATGSIDLNLESKLMGFSLKKELFTLEDVLTIRKACKDK